MIHSGLPVHGAQRRIGDARVAMTAMSVAVVPVQRSAWVSVRQSRVALLLAGLSLIVLSGCQSGPFSNTFTSSSPTMRGQSPATDSLPPGLEEIASRAGQTPSESLVDIRIEGNDTIETGVILTNVRSQVGRPADERQIKEDVRALYATKWFYTVERRFRMTDEGMVLIFRVLERPVIRSIEVRGNNTVSRKSVLKQINLEVGSPYDPASNRSAARKIERYYHEKKSFPLAKVTLASGESREDRDVIFQIEEGPYTVVRDTNFEGNSIRDSVLRLQLKTRRTALGWIVNYSPFGTLFGGKYDESTIPEDVLALKQYYHNLGYFDAEIEKSIVASDHHIVPRLRLVKNPNEHAKWEHWPVPYVAFQQTRGVRYVYSVNEGTRYRLRNIEVEGNEIFAPDELLAESKLETGEYFNARFLNRDVEHMRDQYGKLGRLFAKVEAVPRFIEGDSGTVDLVYRIDEDRPYTIRRVNVHIDAPGGNPHTKENVVRHRVLVSPGELADPNLIDLSKGRLKGQIFQSGGAEGPRVQITRVPDEEQPSLAMITRGQSPFDSQPVPYSPLTEDGNAGDPYGGIANPFSRELERALERPGQADLDVFVTEAQTGRLMFGVGVNSNAGVVGSFVLEENNFDITRVPLSWREFVDGTAFRGNGERFRIEAAPGQLVSRYLASWQTSNFLDTDFTFGVSGFFYNRFLPGWDEDRLGGRLSLGYQLNKWWSATGAIRMEDVELKNPSTGVAGAPPLLKDALGSNFLSTFRASIAHDTRDSSFLPTEGHFAEASFEQAFGDYVYPRFEASATQHWTVWERADGGGRHVLSLSGEGGWTGSDTPIFERFFAGGYQSFRGFAFRGISPRQGQDGTFVDGKSRSLNNGSPIDPNNQVRVGGDVMMLGSLQYAVPITADETFKAVAFTDFGTVEESSDFGHPRVAVGFGARLQIPAMGPAPLAFDFGFPVVRDEADSTRIFSFYIGVTR